MRKINMKRKSRKEKAEHKDDEEENGVEEKSDAKNSSDEEEAEDSDAEPDPEPETKKRKSDKRKSVSFSNKKGKKDVEEEEETQYEVEKVLDEKLVRGIRHYLIRWRGYESESDSWEPESTLQCSELIKKFKASREEKEKTDENASDSPKKRDKKVNKKEKKKDKKKPNTEDNVDWDSGDEFEVDRIIDVYFKRNGKREFLVSWKGYPSTQDSWEPEENLECGDLISKFMSKVNAAKNVELKELRVHRAQTERFTLSMHANGSRRLSRRLGGKQRVQYHDAE